jgi:cell division protein FtsB
MNHSKRTIWQAVNSEHGDRLVQITQEHTRLARSLIIDRDQLSVEEVEIYKARIEQLRKEQESILQQFENVEVGPFADERFITTQTY